jgi:tetratricopeptide (TPR) repeat protein
MHRTAAALGNADRVLRGEVATAVATSQTGDRASLEAFKVSLERGRSSERPRSRRTGDTSISREDVMKNHWMRILRGATPAILLISLGSPATVAADDRTDCQTGRSDVRIAACTRILQSNPSDFNALANRGGAFRMTGEYDRAVADLDQAMRLNPKNIAGVFLERGRAYEGKGDYRLAIADLSEALRRDSTLAEAYFGRAVAYEALGQRDLSMTDLMAAERLDRNLVAALFMQRGNVLRTSHQYDAAIAAFDRSIELNPNLPLAYFGRGASYDEKGDRQSAAADYRKCLESTAAFEVVRQMQQLARKRLEELGQQ